MTDWRCGVGLDGYDDDDDNNNGSKRLMDYEVACSKDSEGGNWGVLGRVGWSESRQEG